MDKYLFNTFKVCYFKTQGEFTSECDFRETLCRCVKFTLLLQIEFSEQCGGLGTALKIIVMFDLYEQQSFACNRGKT